jgi:ABC-2 type transport system permease protein
VSACRLKPVTDWDPMTSLAAACRHLFGNPTGDRHPHLARAVPGAQVVYWAVAMLVAFAPLAVRMYWNKNR